MSLSGRQQPTDGPWFAQLPLLTQTELLILGKCIHERLEAMESGQIEMDEDDEEEEHVLRSILTAVREATYTPNLRTR